MDVEAQLRGNERAGRIRSANGAAADWFATGWQRHQREGRVVVCRRQYRREAGGENRNAAASDARG